VRDRSHIQNVLRFAEIVRECLHDAHSPTSTLPTRAPAPPNQDPVERHNRKYDRDRASDHPQRNV